MRAGLSAFRAAILEVWWYRPHYHLGHANLGITSVYLRGIDNSEIIETIRARPVPTLPASSALRV